MALSKSGPSTPTMIFSSSGPWVIMRMLMPFSPSLPKILPEEPGWNAIFRPTAATMAMPSMICRLSGRISFSTSPTA